MSYTPPDARQNNQEAPQSRTTGLRLPLARPVVTYLLLGLIAVATVLEILLQTGSDVIPGAQLNKEVAAGQYWQLLTSMFLHGGWTHLAFNCYALYILGRDTESFYGSPSFTAIYFVSGLAGSAAFYLFGNDVQSVGASGAIFGLIGAEAAFFLRNRQLFGAFGRERLKNVAVLLVINLVITFAVPNINMWAHLGGLVAGFLLGFGLSPTYAIKWSQEAFAPVRRLVDDRSNLQRVIMVLVAAFVVLGVVALGNQRWDSLIASGLIWQLGRS
jgi:rhomboid protease GluP